MPRSAKTTARGYGWQHQQLRKRWQRFVDAGEAYCARCGGWIPPGSLSDLGHDDFDRSSYQGPEHSRCNRRAPRLKRRARVQRRFSRVW